MKKITLLCLALLGFNNILMAQEWDWMFTTQSDAGTLTEVYGSPTAVIHDAQGNVYLNCTSNYPTITFGNQTFTSNNSWMNRNYLVKLSNGGTPQWIKDTNSAIGISIATNTAGDIYTAGEFYPIYNSEGFVFDTDDAAINTFVSKRDTNGTITWVKHLSIEGNPENQDDYINRFIRPYDVATDASGNVFISGQMRGTNGVFGSITVPVQGEADTFIAKFDANGNALWVKTIIENSYMGNNHIACDSQGNVYLSGSHDGDGTIAFNQTVLGGSAIGLTYLVKYSPDGTMLWVQSHGGDTTQDIYSFNMAVDDNDNIYTVGYHNYVSIAFGDVVLTTPTAGQISGFITKYNSNGVVQWAKGTGGNADMRDVQADNDGTLYALGNFWTSEVDLGEINLTNNGTVNGFVTKIDINGNYLWAEQIGGGWAAQWYMAADNVNNAVYVSGNYNDITLGDQSYNTATNDEIYLAKLNVQPELATSEFTSSQQMLYPNPAKDILNITGNTNEPFTITDVIGRTVAKGQMHSNAIDVSSLPSGIYLLNFNNAATKFIKE